MADKKKSFRTRIDPIRSLAQELIEKPVNYPAPFPPALNQKSLMNLLTGHLRDEEIHALWMDVVRDKSKPERAQKAWELLDGHAAIQHGGFDVSAEERQAVAAFEHSLEEHRILPTIEKYIKTLATGLTEEGKKADRLDIMNAKSALPHWIPYGQETLSDIITKCEIGESVAEMPEIDTISKGLEAILRAEMLPSSMAQIKRIGEMVKPTQPEIIKELEHTLAEGHNLQTIKHIAIQGMGKLAELAEMLIKETHLHL